MGETGSGEGDDGLGKKKNIRNREELMRQMLDRCEGENQAGDERRNTAVKQQKTPQNPRKHTRHKKKDTEMTGP